jgi:menaquinone-dependent protoporphyrinogen oxidase
MTVLVAYGSKRGGTRGLAEMIGEGLRDEGFAVEVVPVGKAGAVDRYDAVIVGGALYAFRWHRGARRFVRSHAAQLRQRPTYLFSSGPLDDSASTRDIPPVKGVQALVDQVGARGHVTFGGRLAPDARGFPASAMAKKNSGDWRDAGQVRSWVRSITPEIRAEAAQGV